MAYQVCSRCVMSNESDDTITFNQHGQCNYCEKALADKGKIYFPGLDGQKYLSELIAKIKLENRNKAYDCLMGISGGLDSSYLAYLGAVKWGLRILAVHVDDGFDTEISKRNIKKLCEATQINLITVQPDQNQFRELVRAFMFACVPNLAMPQDNVLFASLYKVAKQKGIKTFLSGGNYALECILQKGNTHSTYDLRNINDINEKFGRSSINKLLLISELQQDIYRRIKKIEYRPLNFINYNRDRALQELYDYCGFEYYGSKHLENTFTKFVQLYWFPNKFHVDKRKSHFSSMIVSGQLTREEALQRLNEPLYVEEEIHNVVDTVISSLDISPKEFELIMQHPPRQHTDYRTSRYLKVKRLFRLYRNKFL